MGMQAVRQVHFSRSPASLLFPTDFRVKLPYTARSYTMARIFPSKPFVLL